jgi:hypothetical protein
MLRKVILGVTLGLIIGICFSSPSFAQSDTFCSDRNYSNPPVKIAANLQKKSWLVAWDYGGLKYQTYIKFSKSTDRQFGISVTKFYLPALKRNRYVAQSSVVCYKKVRQVQTVAIFGQTVMDLDTGNRGNNAGYSPDNYFLVFENGKTSARLVDNNDQASKVLTQQLDSLPQDIKTAFAKISNDDPNGGN